MLKKVTISDLVSIILAVVIIWLLVDSRQSKDNSKTYIDYIKKEWQIKQNKLKNDSIRYSIKIDSLTLEVNHIKKRRKYEYDKYLSEQSKFNNLTTDSSFIAILDSIKKVCCSNDTSR